jgi:hypothetical protein
LVGKPKGKILCRGEHDIRIDLREVGWEGVEWIHLAQDRDKWQALVNTIMKLVLRERWETA